MIMATLSEIRLLFLVIFFSFTAIPLALIIDTDPETISAASTDFGKIVKSPPAGVLQPSSPAEIANLIRLSYTSSKPFNIGARGNAHSAHGQSLAGNGIVVNMSAMGVAGGRITVSPQKLYVDAGGEQLWVDVLNATLVHGLTPRSWTDYLYLTVGGTLSNAGMGGQAFRFGPQINNVYEMDVITGKGELMTCSRSQNSDLFFAVLGGLGQFGIITRARIVLEPAPKRATTFSFEYDNFTAFSKEQEHLISLQKNGFEAILGEVIVSNRTSAIAYVIYATKYYNYPHEVNNKDLIGQLSYKPASITFNDTSYFDYLNQLSFVQISKDPDVHHPWLNLFVPASRISDFDIGVFRGIAKNDLTMAIVVYPTYRNKWDEKMLAVIPEESVFYSVFLVRSSSTDWKRLEEQNTLIVNFLNNARIKYKQYLAYFNTTEKWKQHLGSKWSTFEKAKEKFDPLKILSPGQKIFSLSGGQNIFSSESPPFSPIIISYWFNFLLSLSYIYLVHF